MKKPSSWRALLAFAIVGALVASVLALASCAPSSSSSSASKSSSSGDIMYTVPNVISLKQADAEKAIIASGLILGEVKKEASDTVPLGCVISQDPAALTSAKANSKVNLVVSSGKAEAKDVAVPDLKGKTQEEAEKALSDVKLIGVASNPEESDAVKPGQVFKQSIEAGKTVKEGTKVAFTVALAPAESTVPNVVGLARNDAKDAIGKADLGFDAVTAYDDKVAEGKVISQSIPAGTKVKSGTTVAVTVSLGPKPAADVKVPDVTTYSWTDAETALHSAGLAARYTGDPAGIVISQDVAAGTMVAPNTLVTVTLASPTPTVSVPNLIGMSPTAAEDLLADLGLSLDITGATSGTIIDQWPGAGTEVEVRTTVTVTVQADPDPGTWTKAANADEAAKGAGVGSFNAANEVTAGGNTFKNPVFSYMKGIAQATYEAPASAVEVRKGFGAAGTYVPGDKRDYAAQWTQNFKGLTINCYGDAEGKASLAEWYIDNTAFTVQYLGYGGENPSMSADEVQSFVAGLQ